MDFQETYAPQITWLLEGNEPSIRYQTLRDLTTTPGTEVHDEQRKILQKGWGRQLLEHQEANGMWSQALYSPKWTSTFYSLLLLKRFGACHAPQTGKACGILLERGFYDNDGGINYWKTWKQGECCITGMLLSMLCHFQYDDHRIPRMVEYLLAEQMPDHGWNCERYKGATHSSFHTTISVLEGLWEYENAFPTSPLISSVQQRQNEGIEFLLQHHVYQSNTTWKPVDSKMTQLSFPPRWHFDILRCLDYFQNRKVVKDSRMIEAIELLRAKQTSAGRWKLERKYPAKVFFDMERVGKESRWNTLRALRVLQWWEFAGE